MTILNWLYWKKQQLIKTEANNAETDLVVLGAEVPFTKRDDGYQDYAMTLKDAVASGCMANNTNKTGVFDIYPYIITPTIKKTCTRIEDTSGSNINLTGYSIEGTILFQGYQSYFEYLGTVTVENTTSNDILPWKTSGSVQSIDSFAGADVYSPLAQFIAFTDTGAGQTYAQMYLVGIPNVVGSNLEYDLIMGIDLAPFSPPLSGDLEGIISFQHEILVPENLSVLFTI